MPGAHADVGGGYSSSFFSNVSLITMIDRIRRHTKIGINDEKIQECQKEIENGFKDDSKIVIHSESQRWYNVWVNRPNDRIIDQDETQYASPIIEYLNGRKIYMQSKRKRIEFEKGKFPIQSLAEMDISFCPKESLAGMIRYLDN
jgi:UDP-N-acetylmuramyl pentapeptide synthase